MTRQEKLAKIARRAAAKRAELRDGMPPDVAARIEAEHAAICAEAEALLPGDDTPATPPARQEPTDPPSAEQTLYRQIASIAGLDNGFADRHAIAGTDEPTFRNLVLNELAERDERNPIFGLSREDPHMTIRVTRDGGETRRNAMTAAIVSRLAESTAAPGQRPEVPEIARQYMGHTLAEMAAEHIGHRGQLVARDVDRVFTRAFHTTSDFPAIFTDALNARLLQRYQIAPATYRLFSSRYTVDDFRASPVARVGDFPTLQPIQESGEIKSGTFGESKEQIRVFPYGVLFNLSRQMIVNDQLGALDQLLGSYGQRVGAWENQLMFSLLLSGTGSNGPTLLTDNEQVFAAAHGNLAGSGADIDVTTVGAGVAAMMKQTSLDGLPLNATPALLLTGPDKLVKAGQLLASITPAESGNAVPEFIKRLQHVADAAIAGNAWYLFASPEQAPCFHYGYLSGFEGPRLSMKDTWSVQGVGVRLEHDFGVAATDFRGGYKNPGA